MNAARSNGSDSPYPWPVNSRQSSSASSSVGPIAPGEPSSCSASSECGRRCSSDQKKPRSCRCLASANARCRSSSVGRLDSSSKAVSAPGLLPGPSAGPGIFDHDCRAYRRSVAPHGPSAPHSRSDVDAAFGCQLAWVAVQGRGSARCWPPTRPRPRRPHRAPGARSTPRSGSPPGRARWRWRRWRCSTRSGRSPSPSAR